MVSAKLKVSLKEKTIFRQNTIIQGINWHSCDSIKQRGRTVARFGMQLTKVFRKVLTDGINSAIVLSFSSSFGRPNNMGQSSKN